MAWVGLGGFRRQLRQRASPVQYVTKRICRCWAVSLERPSGDATFRNTPKYPDLFYHCVHGKQCEQSRGSGVARG